ncbi:MAG: M23 family metallopeptidase [Bauldia sp.]|nr:M23 family metallopeptidase [Bauldia sp.]
MKGSRRSGAAHWYARSGVIELGDEPALASGKEDVQHLRRSVSLRWLSGTVLTGVSSSLLIGGALLAAMDSPRQFVTPASASVLTQSTGTSDFAGKADRIEPIIQAPASRQLLQVSTRTRQDDRDLIRLRPFARISAGLSMPSEAEAAAIPAYDPLAIFGEVEAERAPAQAAAATDQIYGAYVNGEVAIKVVEFPLGDPALTAPVIVADAEVESIVRNAARSIASGGVATFAYAEADQVREPMDDPFAALGVSIVPENVTLIARSDAGGSSPSERILYFQSGDTFQTALARSEVPTEDATAITGALNSLIDLNGLRPGEIIRVGLGPAEIGDIPRPTRVSIYENGVHQATVARTDANAFVRADEPDPMDDLAAAANSGAPISTGSGQMPRLYEAIYQTALDQEVPRDLIPELIKIFSYEVDFQSRISAGDSIEIFHSVPEDAADPLADQEILYASITLGGVTKRFYRFATPDDGHVDYYDEEGNSAQKFLIRKPVSIGVLRSGFGYRRHPILGYSKLHSGTDYAAPAGTPIMAAGDGTVEEAGWSSGYGRYTVIRHANGYETAYAHQSEIASGIVPGARVRQGQVIGYVGSSGLSTGPHLHFEVKINGTFVDPLRIRLPEGRSLDGDMLAIFEEERSRIDLLLESPTPTRVASAQ